MDGEGDENDPPQLLKLGTSVHAITSAVNKVLAK